MTAPKKLRLRSSGQGREFNKHCTAGGGVRLGTSACVRAIVTRYRRGLNRQGSEVENLARVTPGYVRNVDRQTDKIAFNKIKNTFSQLRILIVIALDEIHSSAVLNFVWSFFLSNRSWK